MLNDCRLACIAVLLVSFTIARQTSQTPIKNGIRGTGKVDSGSVSNFSPSIVNDIPIQSTAMGNKIHVDRLFQCQLIIVSLLVFFILYLGARERCCAGFASALAALTYKRPQYSQLLPRFLATPQDKQKASASVTMNLYPVSILVKLH